MRSLDNWTTYDDTWGKPFQGKFTFYKLGTSELISITDINGTPLSNPLLSDMYGRTEKQVFLPDEDVTVVMHKWIGPGSMAEGDTDASHWTLVRSFDNLTQVAQITVDENLVDAVRVANKEALQRMVVPEGVEYAILCGYYEAGDMPPVNYKLVINPDLQDDAGSVIQSCGNPNITNAFWVLIPDQIIDCRVFGVFPKNSYNEPTAWTSQLAHCFSYANSVGRDVFIPQVFQNTNNGNTFSYYWLEGGSFVLQTCLHIGKNVRLCLKTGTTNHMTLYAIDHEGESNIFTNNGGSGTLTLDVRGEMCASWFNPSWAEFPGSVRKVILDTRANPFTFKNTIVEVQKVQVNKTFTFEDCYIESDRKFRNCTLNFTRCGFVSDRWLDSGNTVTLVGNQIRLSYMTSANVYIDWKNKQNEADYGDLGEQTVTGASLLANALVENAVFSGVTINGDTELHNISGNVNINGTGHSLNIVDCWLTLNGTGIILDKVHWRRGSFINILSVQILTQCELWDVEVNTGLVTNGVAVARFERCTINKNITGQGIVCKDCHIHATVTTTDVSNRINFNFDGCYFGPNGRHSLTGTLGSQVVGTWVNNFSESVHPIILDMTKLLSNDLSHTYTYINNNGKFLPRYPKISFTESRFWYVYRTIMSAIAFTFPVLVDPHTSLQPTLNKWMSGVYIPESWTPECHFFAIGTCDSLWKLSVSFEFTQSSEFGTEGGLVSHPQTCTGTVWASVDNAAEYNFSAFARKIVGSIFLAPRTFTYPSEITSYDSSTWPETNSARISIERVR